jgi:hypothetical protein
MGLFPTRILQALVAIAIVSPSTAGALPFGDPSNFERREVDWSAAAVASPPAQLIAHLNDKRVKRKVIKRTIFIDRPGVYDFKNVVHVAAFSNGCDQREGRPPSLHIRSGGVTVKNFICVGKGHDGIHVHSGNGQGWKSRKRVEKVRLTGVWQQACEDALTVGFRTKGVTIERCGFLPNPTGRHRDKLLQINHADGLVIDRCYFGPTKNGIEFKSGAQIRITNSTFDHCNAGLRVNTHDVYGGIRKDQPTKVLTRSCRFIANRRAGGLKGTVVWRSEGDRFERCRQKDERSDGARFDLR